MVSVALFIPNIIGYFRAITGVLGFYYTDSNPQYVHCIALTNRMFTTLYFISYILDAFDGVCARKFNQCR